MTPLYVAGLALTLVTIAVSWVLSRKTLERKTRAWAANDS